MLHGEFINYCKQFTIISAVFIQMIMSIVTVATCQGKDYIYIYSSVKNPLLQASIEKCLLLK